MEGRRISWYFAAVHARRLQFQLCQHDLRRVALRFLRNNGNSLRPCRPGRRHSRLRRDYHRGHKRSREFLRGETHGTYVTRERYVRITRSLAYIREEYRFNPLMIDIFADRATYDQSSYTMHQPSRLFPNGIPRLASPAALLSRCVKYSRCTRACFFAVFFFFFFLHPIANPSANCARIVIDDVKSNKYRSKVSGLFELRFKRKHARGSRYPESQKYAARKQRESRRLKIACASAVMQNDPFANHDRVVSPL